MARGGPRAGAGRKPSWRSGATKAVKLPTALLPQLLAYAHQLDAGGATIDLETQSKPPAPAPTREDRPSQGSVVIRLVDEKQELEKRVARLKDELDLARRKLEKEEARASRLRLQVADASSVLRAALDERRAGVRKTITASAVQSALLALGVTDIE